MLPRIIQCPQKRTESTRLTLFLGICPGFIEWKVSICSVASLPVIETLLAMTKQDMCPALPSPADLPNAIVVVYDGKCRFCTKQVTRLHRWDGGQRLAFISLHDPWVAQRCPDLTHEQLLEQMYVIDQRGRQYGGAAAFRFLTRKLPRLWILAPVLHFPFSLPLWQWCYMQVARRRYQLDKEQRAQAGQEDACDGDACEIHFGKKSH